MHSLLILPPRGYSHSDPAHRHALSIIAENVLLQIGTQVMTPIQRHWVPVGAMERRGINVGGGGYIGGEGVKS